MYDDPTILERRLQNIERQLDDVNKRLDRHNLRISACAEAGKVMLKMFENIEKRLTRFEVS